ncbi:MAG: hypothetical protein ACPLRU_05550, partial [Desulfofundulus sp.]
DPTKCRPEECGYHCVSFCQFGVFEREGNQVKVVRPYECNVGDESCRFQCPLGAITFPTRQELKEMLRRAREKQASSSEGAPYGEGS